MNTDIDQAPLDRPEFAARLISTVDAWPCEATRFYQLLLSGRCTQGMLVRYALATWQSARLFAATLAEMAEKAPDARSRLHLIENLMDEEGITMRASKGLIHRPESAHAALAERFARACGGESVSLDDHALYATGPGRALLAEGRWVEAVANLLLGQEMPFSTSSGLLAEALKRNGLSERDVAFFSVHVEADYDHGQQALAIVLDHALTRELQEKCIAAASAGARLWFEMHGGAARSTSTRTEA